MGRNTESEDGRTPGGPCDTDDGDVKERGTRGGIRTLRGWSDLQNVKGVLHDLSKFGGPETRRSQTL